MQFFIKIGSAYFCFIELWTSEKKLRRSGLLAVYQVVLSWNKEKFPFPLLFKYFWKSRLACSSKSSLYFYPFDFFLCVSWFRKNVTFWLENPVKSGIVASLHVFELSTGSPVPFQKVLAMNVGLFQLLSCFVQRPSGLSPFRGDLRSKDIEEICSEAVAKI